MAGMINWSAIQTALTGWVETDNELPLVWANQALNPAQRTRPYVTLRVVSTQAVGQDGWVDADNTPTLLKPYNRKRRYYGQRLITLQVDVSAVAGGNLGDSAMDLLAALCDSLQTETTRARLNTAALGLATIGAMRDLTALEGAQMGGRASVDITFNCSALTTSDNGELGDFVAQVSGEGEFLDSNPDTTVTYDVES